MAGSATVLEMHQVSCLVSGHSIALCYITILLLGMPSVHSKQMYFSETDLKIILGTGYPVQLIQIGQYATNLQLKAFVQHPDIVQIVPPTIDIPAGDINSKATKSFDVTAHGNSRGHTEVIYEATPTGLVNADLIFLRITVLYSHTIEVVSYIIGWGYFLAWSVSFYPQIYINYRRKSVVGLNFDFLALNIVGFTLYSLFNCGLYFSEYIQDEYFERHPRGLNPVLLNDVFFSLHAAFATSITITQCILFERANQRVSTVTRCIIGVFGVIVAVSACVCAAGKLQWLDFLYYCSYIKLATTLIKYMPQAFMNYRRKSTIGWSIGNIILDFVGGLLSIMQMVLNAHNYDDWGSFFGDATKFGLGLFSLLFDVFFMLQHYVFYRHSNKSLPGAVV